MTASSFDYIALAVAALGPGLGAFGLQRRSAAALAVIGSSLALASAAWLLFRTYGLVSPLQLPSLATWCLHIFVELTFWQLLAIVVNIGVVLVLSGWELSEPDPQRRSTSTWVIAPVVASLCALFGDPLAFGVIFLQRISC